MVPKQSFDISPFIESHTYPRAEIEIEFNLASKLPMDRRMGFNFFVAELERMLIENGVSANNASIEIEAGMVGLDFVFYAKRYETDKEYLARVEQITRQKVDREMRELAQREELERTRLENEKLEREHYEALKLKYEPHLVGK